MSTPPTQAAGQDSAVASGTAVQGTLQDAVHVDASPGLSRAETPETPQKRSRKQRSAKPQPEGGKAPRRRKSGDSNAVKAAEALREDAGDALDKPAGQEPPRQGVDQDQLASPPEQLGEQPAPGSRRRTASRAKRSSARTAPESKTELEPEKDDDNGAAEESVARKRGRRGKRGGKSRGHKAASQIQAIRMPLEIVAAITTYLALPPGRATPRKRKEPKLQTETKIAAKTAKKRMLISVMPREQVEVAIVEDGSLLEYYLDMLHQQKIKGNIYKGTVHNIDTNLQAAFVDYGAGKNGFLQIDQVHPEYWQSVHEPEKGKKFPPIQKILKIGQELLVQVVKEPAGSKGAFLTTWLSLAGRFLVLTPGQEQIGVSRKVSEPEERSRLRDMMNGIDPGKGFGVIVRTVGEGANKTTLKNDLQYLKRLWREIRKRATEVSAPSMVHQEPGLPERSVRDYLTEDVGEIWVDDENEAIHVRNMVSLLYPRKKDLVHLYEDLAEPIWDKFRVRGQLAQIYDREVLLPSGGRLVFDQTEALMAIDINSGRISGKGNFENMAFKTNMEAAEAIAQQLRLRDVGGQVVIDFIEMRDRNHVVEVEKCLRQAMKSDRAKHDVARMSSFGLLELVRQRMGSSALSICLETCPVCNGTGMRRNLEWHAQQSLGELRQKLRHFSGPKFTFELPRELGMYLLNQKRQALRSLEEETGKTLEISITI